METSNNPRDIAVMALADRLGNVSAHLDRLLVEANLPPADRGLARELALGACRRRETLDAVIRAYLAQPGRKMPVPVMNMLRVAIYQMLFLQRVPHFAAVNEAVEQAKRMNHARQSGLVNGLLRTLARELAEPAEGEPPAARDILPVGCGSSRKFARAFLSDPKENPAEYLAQAFSLPMALAGRWLEKFKSLPEAARIACQANTRAPLVMRVNRLKCKPDEVLAGLAAQGVSAQPHENGLSVVLDEHVNVTTLDVFQRGLVQPQDPSATAAAVALNPRPGMNVLDLCASPGAKTTLLAEMMENRGRITALDVSPEKLAKIDDNCRRMGITIVKTSLAETLGGLGAKSFDAVLADVPCSNTGVLARRAEARWRFDEQALATLVRDQQLLAAAAAGMARSGGRIVYSTCSLEPEENEQIVQWLIKRAGNLKLVEQKLTLPAGADNPSKWRDGGYYAILEAR
ncbi:MAG: methyltransferase domain-containing protein [Planctomycetes bacterium]|nr:methyltransferase domain-containing protein [Planctomycetota bacterium]